MADFTIEVGVTRVEDAVAAQRAGAGRLELNSALVLGGLTPSWGLLGETIRAVTIPIMVMMRPRGGGFCYSSSELDVIRRDIVAATTAGAKGVVFGPLLPTGEIDQAATERFVRAAGNAQCVFHRAFDFCSDTEKALEQLIALGVRRVMTSGGRMTALEGAARIKGLIEQAAGRIEILPAGGIRSQTAGELVRETGATQVHASFRRLMKDETMWPSDAPRLGAPIVSEEEFEAVDEEEIARVGEVVRAVGN